LGVGFNPVNRLSCQPIFHPDDLIPINLKVAGRSPHSERKRKKHAIVLAGEHTFMAVCTQWLTHRRLSLEEGRQTSMEQIPRVFKKDVFPTLKHLNIHDISRAHLLDIIAKVEKREALSVAEKLRTWFTQLFTYTTVVVPNLKENPSNDLDVVAQPLPPVNNNPFLRMPELPLMLQTLRRYPGRLNTQLGVRLLLLTGVRTGELRLATPEQFDLERGLWSIPVVHLKQRKSLTKKKRKRLTDIPPYIVPLSVQAQEIVRHLLDDFKPAQVYLFPGDRCLQKRISENTLNGALKRMGYADRCIPSDTYCTRIGVNVCHANRIQRLRHRRLVWRQAVRLAYANGQ